MSQGGWTNVGALLARYAPTPLSATVHTRQHLSQPTVHHRPAPTPVWLRQHLSGCANTCLAVLTPLHTSTTFTTCAPGTTTIDPFFYRLASLAPFTVLRSVYCIDLHKPLHRELLVDIVHSTFTAERCFLFSYFGTTAATCFSHPGPTQLTQIRTDHTDPAA